MNVEDLWAAYERQGVEAIMPFLAPDIVWEEAALAPGAQTWQGREGVRALNRRWQEEFGDFRFERTGEFIALADDAVATPVRARGTGRVSGIPVDWSLFMVFRVRDGLIAHTFFADTLDAARQRLGRLHGICTRRA